MTEESIYNLIPKKQPPIPKVQKYISKFHPDVRQEMVAKKAIARTMGPVQVETRPPNNFLKKHEKEPKLAPKQKFTYPDEKRRADVPKHDNQPLMGLKTTKDFIKNNAVENIMSVAAKPAKNTVDTKGGDKQPLHNSGLEPKYVHKKEFGKVPQYLQTRKEEVELAQNEYNAYIAENFRRGAMKQLSQNERDDILTGLKTNWEQLHHEYQSLSVITDTAPKKYRKERMEGAMKQLERDIDTIEKHTMIYIA